jgi:hypothetical protein
MQTQDYLSRKDASAYLLNRWCIKRSPGYLANLAVVGGGPAFHKAGRDSLYSRSDLDRWAQDKLGSPALTATEHRVTQFMAAGAAA